MRDSGVDVDDAAVDATVADSDAGADVASTVRCQSYEMSTLPGVRIVIPPQRCVFTLSEALEGVALRYRVEIDTVYERVLPRCRSTCCRDHEDDARTLHAYPSVYGWGTGWWPLSDTGLPCGDEEGAVELIPGAREVEFEFIARRFHGQSDTNASPGAPFAPGVYAFRVVADGTALVNGYWTRYDLGAMIPIELVE